MFGDRFHKILVVVFCLYGLVLVLTAGFSMYKVIEIDKRKYAKENALKTIKINDLYLKNYLREIDLKLISLKNSSVFLSFF